MIKEKLKILKDSNIIDEETFEEMNSLVKLLKEREFIKKNEDIDMLITHLAMAIMRFKSGDRIDELNFYIKKELVEHSHYNDALLFWQEIKRVRKYKLSENEDEYILLHLVNLLNKE